jgi:hypothetical protein
MPVSSSYAYWISTGLLSALYLLSAAMYVTKVSTVRTKLLSFGYPGYLVPLLATVKLLGVAAILSRVSVPLSDLAYAGMFFHLLLAGQAHFADRKPSEAIPAIVGLVLLVMSFTTQNAARAAPSPYGSVTALHQSFGG